MPDRDKVTPGDLVYVVFFNGVRYYGEVQNSSEGLFIYTKRVKDDQQGRIREVGFLKDADEVRKAVIDRGHLCFAHHFRFQRPDWEDSSPEEFLPEPDEEDAEHLKQVAKELGCELY